MTYIRIICCFTAVLLLGGCGVDSSNNTSENHHNDVEFTKISTKTINQSDSNHAKELLSKKDSVISVQAINTAKKLLITIEIPHHERLQLAKIRQDLHKEMKKEFPNLKVELSTDKKIIIELEELENKIKKNNISNKKLEKELDRIIKLSKEQT